MAVSASVVTNSVPGFEFVIIGPGLLTRATRDPAFEVWRKTDVFQGGCYTILIWFSVRFFGAIKDASETTWPSGKVETRFLWPPEPQGPTAGYTAPNLGFVETRIIGLTSEPLILRSGVPRLTLQGTITSPRHSCSSQRWIPECPRHSGPSLRRPASGNWLQRKAFSREVCSAWSLLRASCASSETGGWGRAAFASAFG